MPITAMSASMTAGGALFDTPIYLNNIDAEIPFDASTSPS
jgi:hypothetical protein